MASRLLDSYRRALLRVSSGCATLFRERLAIKFRADFVFKTFESIFFAAAQHWP